jgi:hypothetical protein
MSRRRSSLEKLCVWALSQKGGVGKSNVANSFIDELRCSGSRLAAYDGDGGNGSLLKIHGTRGADGNLLQQQDPVVGVGFYDIRGEDRNLLLDSIADGENLVMHDLAGGALGDVTRVVDSGNGVAGLLEAYKLHGYAVTLIHVLSPAAAATQSVARCLDLFGDAVDHVVVRNLFWGRSFPFWNGFTDGAGISRGGKTRDRLLEIGGIEIDFPALQPATFAKMDAANLAPSKAAESAFLSITEKSQIRKYRQDVWTSLQPARRALGF